MGSRLLLGSSIKYSERLNLGVYLLVDGSVGNSTFDELVSTITVCKSFDPFLALDIDSRIKLNTENDEIKSAIVM